MWEKLFKTASSAGEKPYFTLDSISKVLRGSTEIHSAFAGERFRRRLSRSRLKQIRQPYEDAFPSFHQHFLKAGTIIFRVFFISLLKNTVIGCNLIIQLIYFLFNKGCLHEIGTEIPKT